MTGADRGRFGKRTTTPSVGGPSDLPSGETRGRRGWPKWPIILLCVVGVILVGCELLTRSVGPARLGADIVYECKDTSGIHAVGLTWYYHITLKPAKISEKILLHQYISDAEIRWDGDAVGHHFSGHIDRGTGAWDERVDNEIDKSGTCTRVH